MELRSQKEIIEQWLQTPGIPAAHARLLEMLSEVKKEMDMNAFVASNKDHDGGRRLAT